MKPTFLGLGAAVPVAMAALLASTSPARATIDRTVEKNIAVSAGSGLATVATFGGSIRIETGGDGQVRVVAKERVRADSDQEADALLKDLDLRIEADARGVSATAEYTREAGMFHFGVWPPVSVDFVVTVPAGYSGDVKTSGGNIRVADLGGSVTARTSGGSINLGKIAGQVDANTSGGSIALAGGGADAKLSTSGGNIVMGAVAGSADVRTSGGSIKVSSVGGPLQARTSGGNITAKFGGELKGDCTLATSGGTVRAVVPQSAGYYLDASTSGGSVDVEDVTIAIDRGGVGKNRMSGKVGAGGPTLKLRTSGGSVELEGVSRVAGS